jgi:hypothetical protein
VDELIFEGTVVNGIGKHTELIVPGRGHLPRAPSDWPDTLQSGSLNVRIAAYPTVWRERGLALSVRVFDTGIFVPEFRISQDRLGNNRILPTPSKPLRGTGQVWRAFLVTNGGRLECWALRRIDSALSDVLELVSECPIRSRLDLERNKDWPATLTVYGRWRTSSPDSRS